VKCLREFYEFSLQASNFLYTFDRASLGDLKDYSLDVKKK